MKRVKIFSTCLVFFSLIFFTNVLQAQADSTEIPEELISPTNMIPPGITAFLSDSSLYLDEGGIIGIGMGQQYVKTKKEKTTMTIYFDPKTVAMKIVFADQVKRTIEADVVGMGGPVGIMIKTVPIGKVKQEPMYFDNSGYVYTGTKSQGYIKVPFEKLSKLMPGQGFLSGVTGLPNIGYPDGSVTYYGMDVSPKKFPILEWVFVYKTEVFEGNNDFTKEIVNCATGQNCVKYTLSSGADAGSYVLFDSKQRLREIATKGGGYIIYSYQEVNVKLPTAKDMSGYF